VNGDRACRRATHARSRDDKAVCSVKPEPIHHESNDDAFVVRACLMRHAQTGCCPLFRVYEKRSPMKLPTVAIALLSLMAMPSARAEENTVTGSKPMLTYEDVRTVAPALEAYTRDRLLGEVWKRPGLAPRDRSIVTLAALIARNQTIEMPYHLNLALDNGVKPREISEIVTHLAFYAGWANAMAAVAVARDVFAARHIGSDQLPAASPTLLPLNEAAEAQRATRVQEQFGASFPGVVQYTTDVLFRDLWLRPDLAPRDRSLITVSALIASGQVAQIPYHLNRAMDNGLTQTEAAEAITHLAFYAGWPNVFSALPVAKDVFEKRPH
jgi:4-carboxymuconolactone decarboxylase